MQSINFTCDSCQHPLEVPSRMAGEVIGCSSCGNQIFVPMESRLGKAEKIKQFEALEVVEIFCPRCNMALYKTAAEIYAGAGKTCDTCGGRIRQDYKATPKQIDLIRHVGAEYIPLGKKNASLLIDRIHAEQNQHRKRKNVLALQKQLKYSWGTAGVLFGIIVILFILARLTQATAIIVTSIIVLMALLFFIGRSTYLTLAYGAKKLFSK